jgi:hypothetical protein
VRTIIECKDETTQLTQEVKMRITVSHEYTGMSDYWGGNGRRWNDNAGCLFAYYDKDTTLRDCVDQWVSEFNSGGDCDAFPAGITSEDIRAAILDAMTPAGRADYESGALADCAKGCEDCEDCDDYCESPVWIILVEVDVCPDCGDCSGDDTCDDLCEACNKLNYEG